MRTAAGSGGRFVEQDAPAFVAARGDLASGHDGDQDLGGAAPTAHAGDPDVAQQTHRERLFTSHIAPGGCVPCCGSTDIV